MYPHNKKLYTRGTIYDFSLPDTSTHPCTRTCHAPSICPETVILWILHHVNLPFFLQSNPFMLQPERMTTTRLFFWTFSCCSTRKCNNDCLIAKRNARLADALGVSQEGRDSKSVTYSDVLVRFVRGNLKNFAACWKDVKLQSECFWFIFFWFFLAMRC